MIHEPKALLTLYQVRGASLSAFTCALLCRVYCNLVQSSSTPLHGTSAPYKCLSYFLITNLQAAAAASSEGSPSGPVSIESTAQLRVGVGDLANWSAA
jgi:hypothetical protein